MIVESTTQNLAEHLLGGTLCIHTLISATELAIT